VPSDGQPFHDPLHTGPDDMRRMAHATLDLLVDLMGDPEAGPPLRQATPRDMERRLPGGPAPEVGRAFEEALGELRREVLPFMARPHHPRFFAFIPASGTFPGALGDFIASALNIFGGSWYEGAGPARLELVVLDWFKEWLGYPPHAAGSLVSGGSAANLTALACAREARTETMSPDLVLYASDQGHSSIARAARTLGFRPDQLRVLPTDSGYRMRPDALVGALEADRAAGRIPLAVCASAGSTNTGAIDPLPALADVCADGGVWLHVDAAYGGFAALSERGRGLLAGIERADSITLDPHKWLYQPFECGCLLVREGRLLREAFEITPDYLTDAETALAEVNFADLGLQLTRMVRALKVWLSITTFGAAAFREAVDRSLDLAREAQRWVDGSDELELMHGATLGIICFRRRVPGASEAVEEAVNRRLVAELASSGEGFVSSTRLRGRFAIRMCVLNHTTQHADVEHVLRLLATAEVDMPSVDEAREPVVPAGRDLGVRWSGEQADASMLAALPLFAGVPVGELARAAADAHTTVAAGGEELTTRWSQGRDFHVVLEGTVAVTVDSEHVRDLAPGEFFGELAALDWGAGYGYPRLATVTAREPVRLLVLPAGALQRLVASSPELAARIRAAVAERLPRS
jgi:aromatic-L-amino-acid/L-tryptophan decarboxylase